MIKVADVDLGDVVVATKELATVCSPSILKCSYLMHSFGQRRSTHALILSMPFLGTGKNVDHSPSVVSAGSERTEPMVR